MVFPLVLDVISIGGLEQKIKRLKNFYFRRFYRLAPSLTVTLGFSWILVFVLGLTTENSRFLKQAISSLLLVGNFGAYRYSWGNYFDNLPNPLIHLWSLSAEEQIYLIIPLLFLCFATVAKLSKRNRSALLLSSIIIIGILTQKYFFPGFFRSLGFRDASGIIFYSPFSHIWEFAVGGILSIMTVESSKSQNLNTYKVAGFVAFIALAFLFFLPFKRNIDTIYIAILSAIVIQTKCCLILPTNVKNILRWIGDRSYTIYLVHMPIIYILYFSPYFMNISKSYLFIPIIVFIIWISSFIHKNVESRYRLRGRTLESNFRNSFKPLALLIFTPLLIFFLILNTLANKNFSFRDGSMPKYAGTSDKGCDRLNSGRPCYYLVANQRGTALLIGDSIAVAYTDEFIRQSNLQGLTAVTMTLAGCKFIASSSLSAKKYEGLFTNYKEKWANNKQTCLDHNRDISKFISTQRPSVVYLSQHTVDKIYYQPQISISDYRSLELISIESLNKISNRLIVIGPPPLLKDTQVIAQGTLFKIFGSHKKLNIGEIQPEYVKEDEYFVEQLLALGISYKSLQETFCPNSTCEIFKNGKWLYFDPSHLSRYGATFLKGFFTQDNTLLRLK